MKLATLSRRATMAYTSCPRYRTAARISVRGMRPSFMPAREASIISMNTMPLAPSRAEPGKNTHCRMQETPAVSRMPASSVRLPYFSSSGGPITKSSSILPRKWSKSAWPSTWPNSRT